MEDIASPDKTAENISRVEKNKELFFLKR